MGAIRSEGLVDLSGLMLTASTSNGDKAKAIADLNAVKANSTVNLTQEQSANILATLSDPNTHIPEGEDYDGLRTMALEWSAEDATAEQKKNVENNLIAFVNADREKNIPTVLTALGEAPVEDKEKTKTQALTEQQQQQLGATLTSVGNVVGSAWDNLLRSFGGTNIPAPPKEVSKPTTGTTVQNKEGKPLTQANLDAGTPIDSNVKKVGDDLFIQTEKGSAIRVSKDGVLTGIKTNTKSEFAAVEDQTKTLKDGETLDIALTTETKTFEDGDDGSFDKAIPTKILRVEKHGDELRYGVFELKGNDYVLTEGKHSDVKPSAQFKNDQPLRYLHTKDGNLYNEGGKKKWLGPNPSTVGADGGPTDVPSYNSLVAVLNNLTDIEKQKAMRKAGKTQKERQEEDMLMAAASMIGGQGGQVSGGIGGGLGLQMGADSFGNFNVGVGVQGTNFGAGIQFGGGPNAGFGGPGFPGFGHGGVVNLEEMLTVVFAILEQQERKRIVGYLKDMYKKSSAMGNVTKDQVGSKPGILNQMNIETSISQAFLQNSMGKRQNMLETLYGIIRNTHESKRRSIQNLA